MDLLIFDLDGTLVDSRTDIVDSANSALVSLGLAPQPVDLVTSYIGQGLERLFRQLLEGEGTDDQLRQALVHFSEHYAVHMTDHTALYPGMQRTLEYFESTPKVILTNKRQKGADALVERLSLGSHFKAVFGFEAFPTQKPAPGPILGICEKFHVRPSATVMIGDSIFDILAGQQAGAKTVAALYGYGELAEVKALKPDYLIERPEQLIDLSPSFE
jgi:phosphoglycolate phosphatase